MSEIDYGSIATEIGLVKITNAALLNVPVNITIIKLGDSNGTEYTPDGSELDLKNVVFSGAPNSLVADTDNEVQASLELVVPSDAPTFTVREIGAYDEDGDLIYISAIVPRFKPETDQQAIDMSFELVVSVLNADNIVIKVDTSKVLATQMYVDNAVINETVIELKDSESHILPPASDFKNGEAIRVILQDLHKNQTPTAVVSFGDSIEYSGGSDTEILFNTGTSVVVTLVSDSVNTWRL